MLKQGKTALNFYPQKFTYSLALTSALNFIGGNEALIGLTGDVSPKRLPACGSKSLGFTPPLGGEHLTWAGCSGCK